jgi:hypothetical protein
MGGTALKLSRTAFGPPGLIESPVVRVRPSGCATRAGNPRTVRPHGRRTNPPGVARAYRGSGRERSAGIGSALPASRFRRRSGIPLRAAGREPSPTTAPLIASRAPSGHAGDRSRLLSRRRPPGLSSPTALADRRIRLSRACRARHLPSSAFRTLSTAYTPPYPLRAYFVPVTLLGFRLQGFAPRRGAVPLSRPLLSCRFRSRLRPARPERGGGQLQSLHLPGRPCRREPKTRWRPRPS